MGKQLLCYIILFILFNPSASAQLFREWSDQPDLLFLANPAMSSDVSSPTFIAYHARRFKELKSSPTESSLAFVLPLMHEKMTLGLHLFSEKTGPLTRNGVEMNYAYAFKSSLKSNDRISLGMALRLQQLRLDFEHFNPVEQSDVLLQDLETGGIMPPALKVGFQYTTGQPEFDHPVQIRGGASIGQFLPFSDRFHSFDLDRLTEWYTNLGLQIYLSEVTFIHVDILARHQSIVPSNYAFRLRVDHLRFGWLMTQISRSGLLNTQLGFRISQNKQQGDMIRIALGSSWNVGNLRDVLGSGLSIGASYLPQYLK